MNQFKLTKKGGKIAASEFRAHLDALADGVYYVSVARAEKSKTRRQLGFMFAGVAETYAKLYNEAVPPDMYITVQQAAHRLKEFSPVMQEYYQIIDPATGEIEMKCRLRSKAELTVGEMAEHLDDCIRYIWEKFNYVVEPIYTGGFLEKQAE